MTEAPFLDCTVPITDVKPFKGCVLVELLNPPEAIGYITLPPSIKARASMGVLVGEMEKYPGQEGLVRKLGPPDPEHPFEVGLGDRVIIKYYSGTNMRQPPRSYKLVKGTDILAVYI